MRIKLIFPVRNLLSFKKMPVSTKSEVENYNFIISNDIKKKWRCNDFAQDSS